ncbi:MAG: hypothetical protein RJQ09_20500 [Cyclobacteriaceae bacterium]
MKNGDIVFVRQDHLREFNEKVATRLNQKIVIVSGFRDHSLSQFENTVTELLNNPNIQHWFSTNCDIDHPKLTGIPIGLNYHQMSLSFAKLSLDIDTPQEPFEFERFIKSTVDKMKLFSKIDGIFTNANINMNGNRLKDFQIIGNNQSLSGKLYLQDKFLMRKQSLRLMSCFRYVLSPSGNGHDCFRTWEALLLGCIPIVKKTGIEKVFEGLPVIQVDSWDDDIKLSNWSKHDPNNLRLTMDYWWGIISKEKQKILPS